MTCDGTIPNEVFIDFEKSCDKEPKEILWKALEKKGVRVAYIRDIENTYEGFSTSVRTQGRCTKGFLKTIGLHLQY